MLQSRSRSLPLLRVALVVTAVGAGALPAQAGAAKDLWKDPAFQKSFVAGYGVHPDVEPRVTQEEVAVLEAIRPSMADDLAKAETELRGRMKPDCSAILDFTLGGILFQQDKAAEALAAYQVAVGKSPSFRRAWRNLGLIHVRSGRNDDAIKAFTRMIELGGGDGYSFGLLGHAYSAKQDYQAAETAFRNALLLQPESTEWRLGLTRCVFKQEKFQDAASLLDALIARFPEKSEFWLLQAQTFLGMKQPMRAAENLEAVDALGRSTQDSLNTLGDVYASEGLYDLAVAAYTRGVEVDEKAALGRSVRSAEALAARGAVAQARALATRMQALPSGRLEEVEARKLRKLDARLRVAEGATDAETVKVLEEIVKHDPLDGEALLLLGQHFQRQQERERAIFWFERAAGIETFEAIAKLRHAQVLVSANRFGEAIPLLRRAQELKPREEVARYLEQVERASKARR